MTEMMIHLAVIAARLRPEAVAGLTMEAETEVNLRPREPLYLDFIAVD